MRLELVERGFDLPALVVQRGEFVCRGLLRIQHARHQAIDRLGIGHALQAVLDHPHADRPKDTDFFNPLRPRLRARRRGRASVRVAEPRHE
jgi:hypothetical protein